MDDVEVLKSSNPDKLPKSQR